MLKRILSLFLSLLMILSLVPTAVSANATDNDIYINDATSMSELINSGVVDGQKPELQGPTNVVLPDSGNSKPTSPEQVTDDVKQVICDCGAKDAPLRNHFDECMLKKHFMDFCDRSPVWEIYDAWYSLDEDVRDFITRYLETYYPNKVVSPDEIDAINDLTDEQIEEGLTGFASATVDGTTVNANGLPEGSSLTVQEPSKEAVEAIQDSMDILSKNPEQVFLYDISVQNDESSDWQPDGTNVKMELSCPSIRWFRFSTWTMRVMSVPSRVKWMPMATSSSKPAASPPLAALPLTSSMVPLTIPSEVCWIFTCPSCSSICICPCR